MRPLSVILCCVLSLAAWAGPASAQHAPNAPAAKSAPPADTPQKKAPEATATKAAVTIQYGDNDPLGERLAYRLKELLGRSSLMRLSGTDEKKIVIVLTTRDEFPGRPNLSAIYAATWLFAAKEGSLKYFLTTETGIVDATTLDQTAETILGRTDTLAKTYGYLF